jgi:eukaryotic-like serine/threonine-protein kinase
MTPERFQQIDQLYQAALDQEAADRSKFISSACADDSELRREVESLLLAHEQAGSFIAEPALRSAARLLARDQTSSLIGATLAHYRVESILGAGGMGEVYLALDAKLNRKVALKLLPATFINYANQLGRFEQEAQAASALNHPNIITIYEIGEVDGRHFIVTEFVDGQTLREHLTNNRMTVGEVLDVAAQIASALQAAHEAGIVHRDIKPENIMLRRDRVVKVLDFGLAKLLAGKGDKVTRRGDEDKPTIDMSRRPPVSPSVTSPGVVMGTVAYMSPEQARAEEVDARTDIWSLGVVLYEMVAGRTPFAGETPSHVIASILESEPRSLSLDSEVPAELSRIVTKALTREKSERYQTASDIALELKNLKEELTVESRLKQLRRSDAQGGEAAKNGLFGPTETIRESPTSTVHDLTRNTASVEYLVREIKRHKTFTAATLLILLVGAMGLTYSVINRSRTNPGVPGKKSIAVLPLKPINAMDRDDIYEIGIADALILRLGSRKDFVVRQLNATRQYRDIEQDPIAVGKEQQVDYVLAANYQLIDRKIRIDAKLFNVATGLIEQTYQNEKDSADAFARLDEIAAEIENRLLTQFANPSNRPTAKNGTKNEEAYRLYLYGMYLANSRNSADTQKAVEALRQAVRLDPNYALAWAGLAYAQRVPRVSTGNAHETHQKSIEAVNKALALDPNLSEAHSVLCENKYFYEWDFVGANVECKRAIELNPDSSQAHEIYSRYLMGRGRHEEAIAEIKTAVDLDPYSRFVQRNYGRALFYARRYPESAAQLKRVVAMDQNFFSAYGWLTSALALQGNESEAFEWLKKLMSLRKVDEETVKVFETAFQTSGWHGVLREWVKRFETVGGDNNDGAAYNAQIGNKDQAFEYLEKMYQQHESWLTYLKVDPRFDPVRDDPRFVELVRLVESK